MDEEDATCYIIGDTIILPFDLNADDVLNVKNVQSNKDNLHLPKQQGDDKNESSLPRINEFVGSSHGASIPTKHAIDLNEFDSTNQPQTGEEDHSESQTRKPKVRELNDHSRTPNIHQSEFSRPILEISNQHTAPNELDLIDQPIFAQNNYEESPCPKAISADSKENGILSRGGTDKNCTKNMTNNYSISQDYANEPKIFPHSTNPTSHGDAHPGASGGSMAIAFRQDLMMPNNSSMQDSSVNSSESFGTTEGNMLIWPSNMDTRIHVNNFHHHYNPNSFPQHANNIRISSSLFPNYSQPQELGSLPYLQGTNTNTTWDDEFRFHATENERYDCNSTRYTANNYGQECFAIGSRDNVFDQSESDPLGSSLPSETLHYSYTTRNSIDSKNHEHNRVLLTSLHNLIELPTAYPSLPFTQQYPMQSTYDDRSTFPCVPQPETDPLQIIVEDQVSQKYMEQYQTDDQRKTQYNPSSSFMTNRPLDVTYDDQNANTINTRQPNNTVDQPSHGVPQFIVSNALTEVNDVPTWGYCPPDEMAGRETLVEEAALNNQPGDAFIEKILQTVHGEDSSMHQGQSPDVNDYRHSLAEINDEKLQRVLSMERALRGEMHGSMIPASKVWTSKYESSFGSKQTDLVQELDPKTKAEMKREEVANAAKAIFMKRTGTLFHWIHPGESKSELKARVEHAWSQLSEKESNYYFSQVLGRCNSDFQTRPMVNPRLMELLNPEDYRELAGTLNDVNLQDSFLPQTTKGTKSPKQSNLKQRRNLERQLLDQELIRNLKLTSRQETRDECSETDSNCEIIQENTEPEQLSEPYQLNHSEIGRNTENRGSSLDHAVSMTDGSSCGNTLGSSSAGFEVSKIVNREKGLAHTCINETYTEKYKQTARSRGPRGPYKKKGRRSKIATDSDDDWESHNTVARGGASTSGKEKPKFPHSVVGESDSEKSSRSTREFGEVDNNCDVSDATNSLQRSQYYLSESLKGQTTSNETRKSGSRGPRGPYKKRKQRHGGGRGRGKGRGRSSKRRKLSSEDDYSSEECLSQSEKESLKSSQNTDFIKPIWSKRRLEGDLTNNDDSFDPCVSRQCESFSGKVKPSLQLQEELRNARLREDTDNEVNEVNEVMNYPEEIHYDGQQSFHERDTPNYAYGSSLDPEIISIGETRTKLKTPTRAKSRAKISEAFLVESEAMQMQFYREVSSEEGESKAEAIQSLPLTSAAVAVNSLRRFHGSVRRSAQASSGSDTSDIDWSPRQLRCMSGKSSKRGSRSSRTMRPATGMRGAVRKGGLRF